MLSNDRIMKCNGSCSQFPVNRVNWLIQCHRLQLLSFFLMVIIELVDNLKQHQIPKSREIVRKIKKKKKLSYKWSEFESGLLQKILIFCNLRVYPSVCLYKPLNWYLQLHSSITHFTYLLSLPCFQLNETVLRKQCKIRHACSWKN